jgi:hypothetical protein
MGYEFQSVCRNCHHWICHNSKVLYGNGIEIHPVSCGCEEYIPLDNLEYLEWKLDNNAIK